MKNAIRKLITYWLYPVLLAGVLTIIYCAITYKWNLKWTLWLTVLGIISILVIMEFIYPLTKEWKMTGKSFWRDLRYTFLDGITISLARSGFGVVAIYYSERHKGLLSDYPIVFSIIGFLLVFEFLNYWYHRLSHESEGRWGAFLWNIHLTHHLPDKVYVVMHGVFHPLNALITVILIQTPMILLGMPPEAIFAATLLIDLQTLVSHFNVDIRSGFFNYILIGTELHRYHHSADINEAKNYGTVLSLWDIVFGTFYYRPGVVPEKLGVSDPEIYPESEKVLKVLAFPFHNKK